MNDLVPDRVKGKSPRVGEIKENKKEMADGSRLRL